ncbi:MAG: hypothetical protein OXF98_13190 [Rhodospirillaceae bacterium]|nr:hypothetical protein [Rhodospirillaceae bacterium]
MSRLMPDLDPRPVEILDRIVRDDGEHDTGGFNRRRFMVKQPPGHGNQREFPRVIEPW